MCVKAENRMVTSFSKISNEKLIIQLILESARLDGSTLANVTLHSEEPRESRKMKL